MGSAMLNACLRDACANLDEDLQVFQVFAVPLVKRLQELQALAGRAHVHPLPTAVLGGVLVGVLPWIKVLQKGWRHTGH